MVLPDPELPGKLFFMLEFTNHIYLIYTEIFQDR